MTENQDTYDAAVIGAGIVGVSTALHLLIRGKRVILIDRSAPGRETSYGNSGVISYSYALPYAFPNLRQIADTLLDRSTAIRVHLPSLPANLGWLFDFYIQSSPKRRKLHGVLLRSLIARAFEEHHALMQKSGAVQYLSDGNYVRLYRTAEGFERNMDEREGAESLGVPYDIFDPASFREIEPHIKPVFHKAVRWPGNRCVTNPGKLTEGYGNYFTREGGTFVRAEVTALASPPLHAAPGDDTWSVKTESGNIRARAVAVCAGPWAGEMLAPLGHRFPLGFKRGYHMHYAAQNGATLTNTIVDSSVGYLICPMEQGLRITTGAEFTNIDAPSTPRQLGHVLPRARELFPLGEPLEQTPWHGNRPCLPDSLPVIGPSHRHKGLWFNFGHGHFGLTLGPVSGRLLAEMMCREKPFCDPAPFRADRFS